MKALILIPVILLSGCSWLQPKVITKVEYVTRAAPPEMYELDLPIVNADMTTQRGIAEWLVKSELRMKQCENKLNALHFFFSDIQ